jgi:hypothetical protein
MTPDCFQIRQKGVYRFLKSTIASYKEGGETDGKNASRLSFQKSRPGMPGNLDHNFGFWLCSLTFAAEIEKVHY